MIYYLRFMLSILLVSMIILAAVFFNSIKIHLFSNTIVIGKITKVIEPSGESNFTSYDISYMAYNRLNEVSTGHQLDRLYKIEIK